MVMLNFRQRKPIATPMSDQPHSAELFGEQRDFWWNRDFLDLMAARWRLHEPASLADIGCGLGHWSRLLYPYLRPPARLAGVDREPRWVAEAPEKFRHAFPHVAPELFSFHQGDATKLPLDDESFDVVTCQTVLMHLAQPLDALREMLRILRPGGLLVCVEPNNLWNYLAFTSLTEDEPVETLVRRFEFWLRQHRRRPGQPQPRRFAARIFFRAWTARHRRASERPARAALSAVCRRGSKSARR